MQDYKHSLNAYHGQMVFITGDQLAPLGSCMDNTWESLGTTWRPSGIIWKLRGQHLSAKCFETTKEKLTTWRQLWDNYETNFRTSMRHLWLKAKALRQLWDNFETTLGQLWDNFDTFLRQPWENFSQLWDNFEIMLRQLLDNFGANFRELWDPCGTALRRHLVNFWTALWQVWDNHGTLLWLLSVYWQSLPLPCGQLMTIFCLFVIYVKMD